VNVCPAQPLASSNINEDLNPASVTKTTGDDICDCVSK